MSLHPDFPASPYAPLIPEQRWFPADEALRSTAYEKLLPPLVAKVRQEVFAWRTNGYPGASATSVSLLRQWFEPEHRPFLVAKKSIFTKTVGEAQSGGFELSFAAFLETAKDVSAFAKNYLAVGFKLDYVRADGDLSNYTPDFIVRTDDRTVWIVETKGRTELDLPQKMVRLKQWCADATAAEEDGRRYDFVFVDQTGFEKHQPGTFAALATSFT